MSVNSSNSPFIAVSGLRESIRVREDSRIEGDTGWSRLATDEEEAMYAALRNMRDMGNANVTAPALSRSGEGLTNLRETIEKFFFARVHNISHWNDLRYSAWQNVCREDASNILSLVSSHNGGNGRPVKLRAELRLDDDDEPWEVVVRGGEGGDAPLVIRTDYSDRAEEIAYRISFFEGNGSPGDGLTGLGAEPRENASHMFAKIMDVIAHQRNENIHPLTCGRNSNHALLCPAIDLRGQLGLVCPSCGWWQDWIPKTLPHYSQPTVSEPPRPNAERPADQREAEKEALRLIGGLPARAADQREAEQGNTQDTVSKRPGEG